MTKIYTVVGNRPQFMKIDKGMPHQEIIHTGQHFDYNMSQVFFKQLGLPKPKFNLKCKNSGEMFDKLLKLFKKNKPDLVIVYGDTLSTLMGAIAADYAQIPIAHIEAGCRSNTKMPEETNRIIVDRLATVRFATTINCMRNLHKEGIIQHSHYIKGDPMFDAMNSFLPIKRTKNNGKYILLTIHRDFNDKHLKGILTALGKTDEQYIFPAHPRHHKLKVPANIKLIKPVGYKQMLSLESNAKKIVTDSGGVQREAYWMRIPCITLRDNTEWIESVNDGWSILVGSDKDKVVDAVENFTPEPNRHQSEFPVFGVHEKIRKILFKYI
ncbi:MAG: UDP-N-acetylglucosamine 2-epimerase (non-hydrolyzing) [Nanoarchaeota archaeon]|nr:UDP-N-acetylglucosamine 2-epimerase (non-hydrolyzing) [Nanoarchaeota archaeon]